MQGPQYLQRVAEQLKASEKARHSASKYDFVKVGESQPVDCLISTVHSTSHKPLRICHSRGKACFVML